MPRHLKDDYYDCPNCGKRSHIEDVPQCKAGECDTRICPECSSEINWDLEVCPEHLFQTVHMIKTERDKLLQFVCAVGSEMERVQQEVS